MATPIAFAGTGFVPHHGIFATCWHCVAPPSDRDLCYTVAVHRGQGFAALPLREIHRDPAGSDLATAAIDLPGTLGFELASEDPGAGTDVYSFGYPFTTRLEVERRLLRGYMTRGFRYDHLALGEVLSYELDMPCPAGLSGTPVLLARSRRLLGVVYGSNDVATVDSVATVDEAGQHQPEVRRIVSFGLAHHLETLRALRGPATGNRPLADLLPIASGTV